MKIIIATVHFGDKLDLTKEFVKRIQSVETFSELVIANNNKGELKLNMPNVRVIENRRNLGWGGGINSLLPYIFSKKPDFVFIVNNDCFIEKPILTKMANFLQKNEKIGLVSPALKFNNSGETIFDLGGFVKKSGEILHKNVKTIEDEKPQKIDFSGTLLIMTSLLEKIKGFDERFFLYMEDVDLCQRAKEEGFSTYIYPKTVLSHLGSATVGKESKIAIYHQTRSGILFVLKHFGLSSRSIPFFLFQLKTVIKRLKNPSTGIYGFIAIADIFMGKIRFDK